MTQATQAFSSGEAELYAMLRGIVEVLGAAATAEELGFPFKLAPRVGSDSSAARSVASRHGLGRLKVADLERYGDPAKLATMRAIKAALDPHGIMNPGAVLRG